MDSAFVQVRPTYRTVNKISQVMVISWNLWNLLTTCFIYHEENPCRDKKHYILWTVTLYLWSFGILTLSKLWNLYKTTFWLFTFLSAFKHEYTETRNMFHIFHMKWPLTSVRSSLSRWLWCDAHTKTQHDWDLWETHIETQMPRAFYNKTTGPKLQSNMFIRTVICNHGPTGDGE